MSRIEVVVVRDPDATAELTVYVDGVETADVIEHHIDPGAGYTAQEWAEARESALARTTGAVREQLAELYDAYADNEFITPEPQW